MNVGWCGGLKCGMGRCRLGNRGWNGKGGREGKTNGRGVGCMEARKRRRRACGKKHRCKLGNKASRAGRPKEKKKGKVARGVWGKGADLGGRLQKTAGTSDVTRKGRGEGVTREG